MALLHRHDRPWQIPTEQPRLPCSLIPLLSLSRLRRRSLSNHCPGSNVPPWPLEAAESSPGCSSNKRNPARLEGNKQETTISTEAWWRVEDTHRSIKTQTSQHASHAVAHKGKAWRSLEKHQLPFIKHSKVPNPHILLSSVTHQPLQRCRCQG
ncbi:hypothetical protein JOB18_002495 [Solea senegalensis]|uniref:Uncharacterized protein n=1 Tax=Solea senegalensis TaxID=28829 RepID=A0AAV6RVI5_SOLSE|nr:hypothetical protein JOB18_002495 [Solea senegalensis]